MQMQVVPTQAEPQPEPGYQQTELCDCSGSYCKGCWGDAWSLTRPFVWYSLASRIKNKNWGIAILIVAFLYFVVSTIYFIQLGEAIEASLACEEVLGVGKKKKKGWDPLGDLFGSMAKATCDGFSMILMDDMFMISLLDTVLFIALLVMTVMVRMDFDKKYRKQNDGCASCCTQFFFNCCSVGQMWKSIDGITFNVV